MRHRHLSDITKIETTMLKLGSVFSHRAECAAGGGISSSTLLLVNVLAEHYDNNNTVPITITELAGKMSLTPAAISQAMNLLEKHRLVRRKKSAEDKRQTFVMLTLKGKIMLKHMNKFRRNTQVLDDIFEYLGKQDAEELVRIFGRIDEFIEQKMAEREESKRVIV
jgi:DNA-binding MarR family transcriptional regulator